MKKAWDWIVFRLDSRLATNVAVGAAIGLGVFEGFKLLIELVVGLLAVLFFLAVGP